jgi:hypothetical protein
VLVLFVLCAVLSIATWDEQFPTGAVGGRQLARQIAGQARPGASVLIVVRDTAEDTAFAAAVSEQLTTGGFRVLDTVRGQPVDARRAIGRVAAAGDTIDIIAGNDVTGGWSLFHDLLALGPATRDTQLVVPRSYSWPNFLKSATC